MRGETCPAGLGRGVRLVGIGIRLAINIIWHVGIQQDRPFFKLGFSEFVHSASWNLVSSPILRVGFQ